MCSDHQSQHHRDGDEDDKPTVADADYTEMHNIGADNAAYSQIYSEVGDNWHRHLGLTETMINNARQL